MIQKRPYRSTSRAQAASLTRERILQEAKAQFAQSSIDDVRLADIAEAAGVSVSSIYAIFKSREGILRAMMEAVLFGEEYSSALRSLEPVRDPIELIRLTAPVARAIYEAEARELGFIREIAAYSPILKSMEKEFDDIRFERQKQRIVDLFEAGRAREGLTVDTARQLLWMYTGRDVYRMLVVESGWTADAYEAWLRDTLMTTLVST